MKAYTFHCGCDRGACECYVSVQLTEEEEAILKEYVKNDMIEFVSHFAPTDRIFTKVALALEDQCEDICGDSLVIWIPTGMRNI